MGTREGRKRARKVFRHFSHRFITLLLQPTRVPQLCTDLLGGLRHETRVTGGGISGAGASASGSAGRRRMRKTQPDHSPERKLFLPRTRTPLRCDPRGPEAAPTLLCRGACSSALAVNTRDNKTDNNVRVVRCYSCNNTAITKMQSVCDPHRLAPQKRWGCSICAHSPCISADVGSVRLATVWREVGLLELCARRGGGLAASRDWH